MAQSGFTPISLYYSSTTTNVPLASNLANGELALNTTDGKLFYKDNVGAVQVIGWKNVPISTVSGLGTGVATALAINVGTAGSPVVNGGALGTPSSGTVTNLTGTANITVTGGASGAIAATTLSYSSTLTGGTGVVNLGTNQFYKDASGNIGIGTSTPSGKLDITTGTYRGYFDDNGGAAFRLNGVNAPSTLYSPMALNGSVVIFQTSNSERARIDASGNLNIANLTASKVVFTDASKNLTTTGSVGVSQGGTGVTTLTGLAKGNGTSAFTAAVAGTDYLVPGGALGTPSSGTLTNATGLPLTTGVTGLLPVASGGTGTSTPALVAGSNVTITGTWPNQTIASGGGGTVSSVSVTSANGLAGTVATATTTPAITLSTSVTGIVKGNGTALSAATAGTDYVAPGGALGTPSSGTVTNLTGTANITVTGGASGAIAATTLSASSTVSGTGFSTYLASPPAIGGTAAAAVSSTNLSYTGTLTGGTGIVNIGSNQVYKDASGNVGIGVTPTASRGLLQVNGGILGTDTPLSVKQFGAVGDGTTNDTSAINAAFAQAASTGRSVYVPAGRYLITSNLTASSNLHLYGDTATSSVFLMSGAATSLVYTGSGTSGTDPQSSTSGLFNTTQLLIERMGFAVITYTASNTRNVISATWSNSASFGNTAKTFTMRDCDIYAAPPAGGSTTSGNWNAAVYLAGAWNSSILNSRIMGARLTTKNCNYCVYMDGGTGLATKAFTEVYFEQVEFSYVATGVYASGYVEGVNVLNSTILECDNNVVVDTGAADFGRPLLLVSNCHFTAYNGGVVTSGWVQMEFSNNLFYRLGSATYAAITLNSSNYGALALYTIISNNLIQNVGSGGTLYGVIVNHTTSGGESVNIMGNYFVSLTTGIQLNTGTIQIRVMDTNRYVSCTNSVVNNGSTPAGDIRTW